MRRLTMALLWLAAADEDFSWVKATQPSTRMADAISQRSSGGHRDAHVMVLLWWQQKVVDGPCGCKWGGSLKCPLPRSLLVVAAHWWCFSVPEDHSSDISLRVLCVHSRLADPSTRQSEGTET